MWAWPADDVGAATITFEGLQDNEQVNSYYDGGSGSLGSTGGPDLGVAFTSGAFVRTETVVGGVFFTNPPSPETALVLPNDNSRIILNFDGGLQSLDFFYVANFAQTQAKVWSGPDATGTLLASTGLLPVTDGPPMSNWTQVTLPFSGVGLSVSFQNNSGLTAIDDISFTTAIPEPGTGLLLLLAMVAIGVWAGCHSSSRTRTRMDPSDTIR